MISKTQEDFLWGALIAGAVSAAAVILFTPISGEKLRNRVLRGIDSLHSSATKKRTYQKRKSTSSRKNSSPNGGSHSTAHHHAAEGHHHTESHSKPKRTQKRRAKASKDKE